MKSPRGLPSLILLLATGAASWYGMMVIHESGHVLGAWLSGGRVSRVVLDPLVFSRTDLAKNPHPMFVVWAGPAWGCVLPLALWLSARAAHLRLVFLLRAFAGFCLIVNGAYLASAAIMPVGDCEDLIRLGAPLWTIVTPGLAAFVAGLAICNGLGSDFGLGGREVDRRAIYVATAVLALLVIGMLAWTWLT